MQLPKKLPIPDIESIHDIESAKMWLRQFCEDQQRQHRQIRNDMQAILSATALMVSGDWNVDGSWRFYKDDTHMNFQERVSGTWQNRFRWKRRA